jgi:transcription elongation factor Elf1
VKTDCPHCGGALLTKMFADRKEKILGVVVCRKCDLTANWPKK